MAKELYKYIKILHLVGDIAILNFAFFISFSFKLEENYDAIFSNHYSYLLIVYNSIWMATVLPFNIYNIDKVRKIEHVLLNASKSISFYALILFAFITTINGFNFSTRHLLNTYIIMGMLMLVWKFIIVYFIRMIRNTGANDKQVIIIGAGVTGNKIYNYFKTEFSTGYRFLGFFDDNITECLHQQEVKGNIYDVQNFVMKNRVDEIFCTLPLTATQHIRELITFADNNLIRFKLVPDFRGFLNKKVQMDFYDSVPVLTLRREPLENMLNRAIKRTFDILFSLCIILFLFPLIFPAIILLIKIFSPGPAFFIQKRSGKDNKPFLCYKFRTMSVNKYADTLQACKEDCRITPIGRFLRKSNLDELPQFFNVLFGHMSVVGPRPHMLLHTKEYATLIDKFMVRHLVKPGITGWAQVNGYRGNTADPKHMVKRVKYDMWYIENWTFLLDIKIILRTVYNMVKGEANAF